MANLWSLTRNTLLQTAKPDLAKLDEPNFSPRPVEPDGKGASLSSEEVRRRRIWHYDWSPGNLTEIRNLTIRHRMMGDMEMPVCNQISWGPVSVTYRGKTYPLPLTKDYLVWSGYIDGGSSCQEGVIRQGASQPGPSR